MVKYLPLDSRKPGRLECGRKKRKPIIAPFHLGQSPQVLPQYFDIYFNTRCESEFLYTNLKIKSSICHRNTYYVHLSCFSESYHRFDDLDVILLRKHQSDEKILAIF